GGAPTVVYGADLTAPAAHRWKTQLNENAKLPAFWSELPEADHNEICGWSEGTAAEQMAAVLIEDCDQHPRERRRFELTAEAVAESGATVVRIETAGETRVERLLWATLLGDLVSIEVARQLGVDPERVDALDRIKEGMSE
ncbi:MAG TPA: SIS domain-containing protein, partial [Solirubrobacterales bacterium]